MPPDAGGMVRLFPHRHGTDAFTAVRLRRKGHADERASRARRRRWLGPLGWIAGVTSVILGAAGVGAVLCLWYPALLTTPALREVYDMRLIRGVIKARPSSPPRVLRRAPACSSSAGRRSASPALASPRWPP